ncbi:class I SAM-dependent methyltransferase [Devosia aquimaris]|uniref:class I SAM-dependent methyltransferase n=1 Tax=Devosia aquimaris TaxID=2866214 RepID=UPI001CD18F36|nr:50S ribosomal protein L11 methyltransferase [Devosia sp. CJK-A8-3]
MEPADFITSHLQLKPVPGLPGISLYTAHAGSRLSRLFSEDGDDPPAPYWAYPWAGGLALAHHFAAHPELVAGKRVLDLGAGSGLVGIAAAQAGALVQAAEIDANGRAAIGLNAAANGVAIPLREIDLDGPAPKAIDLIAAGDVFYNAEVAALMLPFLRRCQANGITVLIGDPDRRDLPRDALTEVARYTVSDVGDARDTANRMGVVYRLR